MDIIRAMQDPKLFGPWFGDNSWDNWRIFLKSLFSLPLEGDQFDRFTQFTGRTELPESLTEAWMIVGRRGGKSLIAALIAVYLATFRDYRSKLAPGEIATLMVIAADRRQARVIIRYINGFLDAVPMLAALIEKRTQDTVALSNRVSIEIHTASFRAVRGYTLVAAVCDEIAFWRSEDSANPDYEILSALRPGLASMPGSLLLALSSPYSRRGELWKAFRRYHGQNDPHCLVWRAPTLDMNPTIPKRVVSEAMARDSAAAQSEWLGEFRQDVSDFLSLKAVESCVVPDRHELPPIPAFRYQAFCDPSGGSRDSMTLAVGHLERNRDLCVLDVLRERRPPFSPDDVVQEFARTLKRYRISSVQGDRYAGEWVRQSFRKNGISYMPAKKPKSDIYGEVLPLINAGRVELLDLPRLKAQLTSLERRTSRAGKDSIDHPPGGFDDLANAACGALCRLANPRRMAGVL